MLAERAGCLTSSSAIDYSIIMVEEDKLGAQAPYPLAMVVCDAIWRDPGTGKSFILGCFESISATEFPCTHPLIAVYVALTDGRGSTPIKLRLVDVEAEEEPLVEMELDVEFQDPRMVAELTLHMKDVAFPKPGEYRFQLSSGTAPLLERRIIVKKIEKG